MLLLLFKAAELVDPQRVYSMAEIIGRSAKSNRSSYFEI